MSENSSDRGNVYPDEGAFRDVVTAYLENERKFVGEDISEHKLLLPEEKEQLGLLIRNATLRPNKDPASIVYETPGNLTKLRPGDEVIICEGVALAIRLGRLSMKTRSIGCHLLLSRRDIPLGMFLPLQTS